MKIEVKGCNPNKLHDELVAKGLIPTLVTSNIEMEEHVADTVWIAFADGTDLDAVQQVIDDHDPTPIPAPPTPKERLEALEETVLLLLMEG